jgi:hypothetical protein
MCRISSFLIAIVIRDLLLILGYLGSTLSVVEGGGAGENHTVGVIIDHDSSRTNDACPYDGFVDTTRCKSIAKEKSVETIEFTELIKDNFTVDRLMRLCIQRYLRILTH